MNKRRVVVTGMGTVNPLGLTIEEYWKNLLDGVSGAADITLFDTTEFKTKFACELKGFDASNYMDRKASNRMDPFTHYAVAAAKMAMADSGLDTAEFDKNKAGVIIGSGIGGMWTNYHQQGILIEKKSPRHISPFFIPMLISDIAAGHVSIIYGLKGPNYGTVSACATSSHAIGDALMHIQRGSADVMLTGGSEAAICPMGIGGFNSMRAISMRNDDPKAASRPFDKDRDGFVMGEGAGLIVLEELEHAQKRGAKIHAEILGLGFSGDAYHITEPAKGGEGVVRCMRAAIEDSGLTPDDIDLVNAHGTSTPYNDKSETEAIKTVYGERAYKMKVNSTKSMVGHLLGASGAVESIATILMVINDKVHPTINQFTSDPDCDLDYVPNKAQDYTVDTAVTNTLGFGGHNTSLVFRKYHD
jgi:3-oxoacyl-[acyl-carrier-protein] synthase II